MAAEPLCAHCRLPLGAHPRRQRLHGESRTFCCYGCVLAFQVSQGVHEESDAAWLLIRLGVGAFLAMNIMLFSLLLYSGSLGAGDETLRQTMHIVLLALSTPALIILGGPFLRHALDAASHGQATIDTLICLGAGTAYGYSVWMTATGGDHVYFDTATMVVVLFTLGRYLEAAGRARAMRDLEPLLAPERQRARLLDADGTREVAVTALARGDRVQVRPGERIPVDGRVVAGVSGVDESLLSGEPRPVIRRAGMPVLAGSINTTGELTIETVAAGSATRWAELGRNVATSLRERSPIQRLADRAAAAFVYVVAALAAATASVWALQGAPEQALMSALAVLVVACPCALGLAAPLATSLGLGVALRQGCLVRSGAALETLAGVRTLLLDKTGTVTEGRPRLHRYGTFAGGDETTLLDNAAALQHGSEHPLARALCAAVSTPTSPAVREVRAEPGRGVCGRGKDGRIAIGTRAYLASLGWHVADEQVARAETMAGDAAAVSYVAWGADVRGWLTFEDTLRPDAGEAVRTLHAQGIHTELVSGDRESAVAAVAHALGASGWQSTCSPEAKVAALAARQRQTRRPVAAIGDGLNDAPVLAAAEVGIAVGSATDLAREAAEITLPPDGLARLPDLVRLARRVRRIIAGNLAWAFGYNAVALALAAAGLLQPVLAAALMAGSSVLVILNSLRLAQHPAAADGPPHPDAAAGPESRRMPGTARRSGDTAPRQKPLNT
ncbi:heavy metal translocating P-type ATPase [Arhodomonas sp. AD133]|uniref:heavy metal translocating P-type ATPase n=1 Tax=Arhodomonas sp. AD133 TaxID=3415009 RepID=UPI003EBF7EAD